MGVELTNTKRRSTDGGTLIVACDDRKGAESFRTLFTFPNMEVAQHAGNPAYKSDTTRELIAGSQDHLPLLHSREVRVSPKPLGTQTR